MNKPGRPAIEPGFYRVPTSVSLSNEERILLRRFGGSQWLRLQIQAERQRRESTTTQPSVASESDVSVGSQKAA